MQRCLETKHRHGVASRASESMWMTDDEVEKIPSLTNKGRVSESKGGKHHLSLSPSLPLHLLPLAHTYLSLLPLSLFFTSLFSSSSSSSSSTALLRSLRFCWLHHAAVYRDHHRGSWNLFQLGDIQYN